MNGAAEEERVAKFAPKMAKRKERKLKQEQAAAVAEEAVDVVVPKKTLKLK